MPYQLDALSARFSGCKVRRNVGMAQYTSFQTGGPASVLVEPQSIKALSAALAAVREAGLPYEIIGNGTNLLVSDAGIDAVVFRIGEAMSAVSRQGEVFFAEAGALLSTFAKRTVEHGFTGLEWAAGIPGSIGGAISMNAGAYGGEIGQRIKKITYIDTTSGAVAEAMPEEGDFAYRHSAYRAPERVVVSAEFLLQPDDGNAKARMAEYAAKRREKQPLAFPSAGSTFKRPQGGFAGALIEQAGLMGARVGGAEVSTLHAGFIINTGGATSCDVFALMCHVQQAVHQKSGIWLEPEVRLMGEFPACANRIKGGIP